MKTFELETVITLHTCDIISVVQHYLAVKEQMKQTADITTVTVNSEIELCVQKLK
jgi:hypothetical protein